MKTPPLNLGYGGVRVGFIVASEKRVHFSGGILLGGAAISLGEEGESSGTFVVEPDAAVEVNVASWVRLAIGSSYRMMPGGDGKALRYAQVSGPAAGIAVKLGTF